MVRTLLLTGGMKWLWPLRDGWKDYAYSCGCREDYDCPLGYMPPRHQPWDLIVTAGYRHLIPGAAIKDTKLGVVGFHGAKLPEYPGRAPVPWAILRGDAETANTMLYLTDEPDAGDIIDSRTIPVTTASEMNRRMGETAAEMLRQHLPALLTGTAPRTPQDRSRRGPLTTSNGWSLLPKDRR